MALLVHLGKWLQTNIASSRIFQFGENLVRKNKVETIYPPIFILGVPRSGSTLLYQLLTNQLKVAYISNLNSIFYKSPVLGYCIESIFNKNKVNHSFESNYGVSKGISSPSELGALMRYWFQYDDSKISTIQNSINTISEISQKPLVLKNLNLNFHIQELYQIFPNALFIVVKRDLPFLAQSIFKSLEKNEGTHIKGFEKSDIENQQNPINYIVTTIEKINQEMETELKTLKANSLILNYSQICESPQETIEKVMNAYPYKTKISKNSNSLNHNFVENKKVIVSEEIWERIVKETKNI